MTAAIHDMAEGPREELVRRLALEMERVKRRPPATTDPMRGLYVSEQEAGDLIRAAQRDHLPVDAGRVQQLSAEFGLSNVEVDILLACLAPDLDGSFERIYSYLQDDLGKKRPTIALLLRMFSEDAGDGLGDRAMFGPGAPLIRSDLLNLPDGTASPFAARAPWVDERIVGYLSGSDDIDSRLSDYVRLERSPQPRLLATSALEVIAAAMAHGHSGLIALTGAPSSGKAESARVMARDIQSPLLLVNVPVMLRSTPSMSAQAIRLVMREARLLGASVYWSQAQLLWDPETPSSAVALAALEDQVRTARHLSIFGGGPAWEPPPILADRVLIHLRLPMPNRQEREEAWRGAVMAHAIPTFGLDSQLAALAGTFRLTVGQISEAVLIAKQLASLDGRSSPEAAHLQSGARAVSGRRLTRLAQEIDPKSRWEQLILPDDSVDQLRELCSTVRTRSRVLEEFGFGSRLTGGRGVTALFAGISGTGKTMAAEVIAAELGLPLFRIELSTVVSKWIGETEKNLDQVFEAAADSNALLFIDEADALFGKRSEVRDSHDRYANLEISYLLQKMESYEGIAILATNMRQQIDDAFLRRLTFTVLFPLPEVADRRRIWGAVWPSELPRADDVDFERLARLKLTGGNIKNIVLAAAHRAVADERAVCLSDVVAGVRRELQKLGKQTEPAQIYLELDVSP